MMRNHLLVLLLCAPMLTACIESVVAAALGTGYVAKKEIDKSKEKQKRAEVRVIERKAEEQVKQEREFLKQQLATTLEAMKPTSDESMQRSVNNLLLGGQLTHVLSIRPEVQNGVVTLYGTVPSPLIADRAVESVRRMPGVRAVVSQLFINERRIEPILDEQGKPIRPVYPHRQRSPGAPAAYGQAPRSPLIGSLSAPGMGQQLISPHMLPPQGGPPPVYGAPQQFGAPTAPQGGMPNPAYKPLPEKGTPSPQRALPPPNYHYAPPPQAYGQMPPPQYAPPPQAYGEQVPLGVQATVPPPGAMLQAPGNLQQATPEPLPPGADGQPFYYPPPQGGQPGLPPVSPQQPTFNQYGAPYPPEEGVSQAPALAEPKLLERPPPNNGREHWYPKYVTPQNRKPSAASADDF